MRPLTTIAGELRRVGSPPPRARFVLEEVPYHVYWIKLKWIIQCLCRDFKIEGKGIKLLFSHRASPIFKVCYFSYTKRMSKQRLSSFWWLNCGGIILHLKDLKVRNKVGCVLMGKWLPSTLCVCLLSSGERPIGKAFKTTGRVACFSTFNRHPNHQGFLSKSTFWLGLGWNLRVCISSKFAWDVYIARLRTTLKITRILHG